MEAEFDTVAAWTAAVVAGLEPSDRIPAACRGSGSPAALHWFLDRLCSKAEQTFLDSGAGIGGPAAFAAREAGVRPVLTDPEAGACRAARSLFGFPVIRAGTQLPIATGALANGWSLGVLCTVADQRAYLAEVRRVLHPAARFGLLVYSATHAGPLAHEQPEANHFPTVDALDELLEMASMRVLDSGWTDHFATFPSGWEEVTSRVQRELEHRHRSDPRWQAAQKQSSQIGSLLAAGEVRGRMLVVQPV